MHLKNVKQGESNLYCFVIGSARIMKDKIFDALGRSPFSISIKIGSLKKLLFKNGFYTKFVFKANFMVVWGGGLGTNFGF